MQDNKFEENHIKLSHEKIYFSNRFVSYFTSFLSNRICFLFSKKNFFKKYDLNYLSRFKYYYRHSKFLNIFY